MTSLRSIERNPTILDSITWVNTGDAPISLYKVKSWMKEEESDNDADIDDLINEVIDLVENSYYFTITDKTVTALWSSFDRKLTLPMAPVIEVTSVKVAGEEIDFHVNGNIIHFPHRRSGELEVVYKTGWETVPVGILLGLKKAILSAYEDRQDVAGMSVELIPGHSRQIFKKYRRY